MKDYKVEVNGIETCVNKEVLATLDCIDIDTTNFHVLNSNVAYHVCLMDADFSHKNLKIVVNGTTYDVKIEDAYDQMVSKMGLNEVTTQKLNDLKAPMPGLIIDILVEVGQEITVGTPLLVLSAMKMENIILSQGEGVIKSIAMQKNDAVEKGEIILEME